MGDVTTGRRVVSLKGTYVDVVGQRGKIIPVGESPEISLWTPSRRLINGSRKVQLSCSLPTKYKLIGSIEIEPDPIVGASVKRGTGKISGRGEIGTWRERSDFRNLGHISCSDVNPDIDLQHRN